MNRTVVPTIKPVRAANVVSAMTARTQFGQIMRRASQKNERFLVDRRGEPAVIIMSVKDYIEHIAPTPDSLRDVTAEAKRNGLNKLSMRQIDAEIAAARRERHGKEALKNPSR
jgi:prevent-host-death family protein